MCKRKITMFSSAKTFAATTLVALMTSQVAHADGITLGKVGYAGSGCPVDSASVNMSEDKKTVSILFDELVAEAGIDRRSYDRKKCDISISVRVPNGFSVSLVDADYRGFTELPKGARARFTREYFFAGRRGPRFSDRWKGERSDDFYKKDRLGLLAQTWSPCGADVILRANTSIAVKTKKGQQAVAGVDSADYTSKTIIHHPNPHALDVHLKYKRCK